MGKFLFILLLTLFSTIIEAQTFKLKALEYSSRDFDNGIWSDWSKEIKLNFLVTINFDDHKIKVFNRYNPEEFDIVRYYEIVKVEGHDVLELEVVDSKGYDCGIKLIFSKKTDEAWVTMYVMYGNFDYMLYMEPS
ncbi:hypothetical protein NLM59_06040 [Weeksellaceae bacterium KMM 9724]|uniref:hypothetical protein n=1 Tax=Profundicola chukchiensis TaxID=2961959 RepID=UPI0024403508|nr:hypothetical protein [Profundicola chukchiensis]MDG4950476.1 hypothetical protein [Profundicola chukchiensis]